MSDNLLATKVHIPPLHGNRVNRANLLTRLNEGIARGCCVTIISAPAGYGKSTLLSEWQAQADIPVAWLSLERGVNTPAQRALQGRLAHLYAPGEQAVANERMPV